ncbi:MAG TPA: hypothetical protein VEQ58_19620 [Polyangiaceae bacterium]|nr:hypothetical protein [Polyangiaceae bacterium]
MPNTEPDSDFDLFRYDLVAYLALRFGVSNEVALSTLGDWLMSVESRLALVDEHDAQKRAQ